MQRFKLLGLALVAVFASAAALSSSAFSALPVNLPTVNFERTWTGASDGTTNPKLIQPGQETLECEKAPAEGTEEAGKPLGLFHIIFEGCKTAVSKVKCTGLGDLTGLVLALGSWHLVFDKLGTGTSLLTAMLFLFEHVHFTCAFILILLLGALLCLHLKPEESNRTHLFHCVIEANGDQEDKTYENNNGSEVTAGLLCSVSEAAEVPCAELLLGSVTHLEAIFADI